LTSKSVTNPLDRCPPAALAIAWRAVLHTSRSETVVNNFGSHSQLNFPK
jgi:hypothetical protein